MHSVGLKRNGRLVLNPKIRKEIVILRNNDKLHCIAYENPEHFIKKMLAENIEFGDL